MSNSSLVTYTRISPNKHSPRNHAIDRITIHCVVGQVTVERLGDIFATPKRQASSNYGVGCDGRIGLYVDEGDRSWCSDSATNDNRAITIEVASDTTDPYAVTDTALTATVDLCEDICRRHGKKQLLWFGNREQSLSYAPREDEMVMTVHRWFAAKACPGDYLMSKHLFIANEVTRRLHVPTYEEWKKYMDRWLAEKAMAPADAWAIPAIERVKESGLMVGDASGNFRPQSYIRREEVAAILAGMLPES